MIAWIGLAVVGIIAIASNDKKSDFEADYQYKGFTYRVDKPKKYRVRVWTSEVWEDAGGVDLPKQLATRKGLKSADKAIAWGRDWVDRYLKPKGSADGPKRTNPGNSPKRTNP